MNLRRIHITMPRAPKTIIAVAKRRPLVPKGPSNRRPQKERAYSKYRQTRQDKGCDFCQFEINQPEDIIETTKHFVIVKNKFQYDLWDGCPVSEHFLISPRRHVRSISEFTADEKADYLDILCAYESNGYSIYARSDLDFTKSVVHQHTHFIKLVDKRLKSIVYMQRPHVLIYH